MRDYTPKNKKGYVLDEEQNEIVEALINNDFYFNCAQTGFGKTITTVSAAIHKAVERKEDDIHFVLMLPKSAEKAFRDTVTGLFGLSMNFYTADSFRAKKGSRFHVFNYSSIGSGMLKGKNKKLGTNDYFEAFTKLKKKHPNLWLIADEAHNLQDPTTLQYRMMKILMPAFIGAWGLTASPILNSIDGLYHMTDLFKPGFLARNIYAFRYKYCELEEKSFWITKRGRPFKKTVKDVVGYKHTDQLEKKFSEISIIKAKQYNYEFFYRTARLSNNTRKYYKFAAAGLFNGTLDKETGKTKKSRQEHSGARLHDLQRVVSNSHPDFKILKDPEKVTEKEQLLVKTIKEVVAKDESVLIYFSYIPSLERVKFILNRLKDGLGIPHVHEVSGNINYAQRKRVESSIEPGDVTLITSAGTESINLQRSNNLIFYETPFPIREFVQACGRIARFDSNYDKFNVYVLEAEGTIDTYKRKRLQNHMGLIKTLLGGKNSLPVEVLELSKADKEDMKKEYLWWKG